MDKGVKGLVTIGLQTFNRANSYLKPTVDSILAQTYKNFELVISDNASSDNTEAVCRDYEKKDKRVRYVRQKTNIGYVPHVNFLRTQARGEYFVQACDDDLFLPTFLEKCVARLDAHPEAIMAASNFIEFDGKGNQTEAHDTKLFYPSEKDLYKRLKQYTLFYESDGKEMFIYCGVWRREAVANYFFINSFLEFPGDWDFQDMNFVFSGLSKGTFEFADEVLFHKRTQLNSFDPPKKKNFLWRFLDSFIHSRLRRFFTPFFYKRMLQIMKIEGLSIWQKKRLIIWTLFVMSRLLWEKRI